MDSKFNKVLKLRDILGIAFGAMIGWGWVINSGDWLINAGFVGSIIAFLIGGLMVLFVGFAYAELTSAMPRCGGEHIFSLRAFGPNISFICTWAIVLGYLATAAFEAAAFPTVIKYLFGETFNYGLMYYVGETPIYASYVIVGVLMSIIITVLNILGVKKAVRFQNILTCVILLAAALLFVGSLISGSAKNINGNLFGLGNDSNVTGFAGGVLTVTCMTPFLFVGFDVIPQAAEEVDSGYKQLGKMLVTSIILTVLFYLMIVFAVSNIFSIDEIQYSMKNGLVSADAMSKAWSSKAMGIILIIGGLCGIITSWNSFILGGSRALYSLGEAKMIPKSFSKLTKNSKAPYVGIILGGALCSIAPFFGKPVLIWLVDAAGFGCCIAYFIVSLSFVVLRKNDPQMDRPFKVVHYRFIGCGACIMSAFLIFLYIVPLPFSNSSLCWQEWVVVGSWAIIGLSFYLWGRIMHRKLYGKI